MENDSVLLPVILAVLMIYHNHAWAGFEANKTVDIEPEDYEGPVSSTPTSDPDHLLYLAWVFVIVFTFIFAAKSSAGKRLVDSLRGFGREHRPIDWLNNLQFVSESDCQLVSQWWQESCAWRVDARCTIVKLTHPALVTRDHNVLSCSCVTSYVGSWMRLFFCYHLVR